MWFPGGWCSGAGRVGGDAVRLHQDRGAPLRRHHTVVLVQVGVAAARGVEDVPQPARNTTVACGRRRRLRSLAVPPPATSPTHDVAVSGCGRTPALTSETCGAPAASMVTSTARK